MILRRIREHAGTHNWFAVSIDLLIVVLGVFLGTQVSNWNSDRLAHEAGATYRSRIVQDISDNEHDMQVRRAYFQQIKRFALAMLDDLDGGARMSDNDFLVAAYQATQIYPRPMVRTSYDEVLSVGAVNTLGAPALRQKLANYYVGVDVSEVTFRTVTAYRETGRRSIPYAVQSRVRELCAEHMNTTANGFVELVLPARCTLDLPPAVLARAAARVRGTPGLELDVTRLLADVDQKIIQFDRSEARAHRMLADLRATAN